MKNLIKKLLPIFLIVTMIIPLAGCAGCGGSGKNEVKIDKDTIYKETELNIKLPENCSLSGMEKVGDKLFLTGNGYDRDTYESYTVIGSCNLDGSELKISKISADKGWVTNFVPLENETLAAFMVVYNEDYSDPDNPIYEEKFYGLIYDLDGKEQKRVDLSDLGVTWINNAIAIPEGRIFLTDGSTYIIVDDKFNVIKSVPNESNDYGSFYRLKDGSIAMMIWGEKGEEFYKFDLAKLEKGEKLDTNFNTASMSVRECGQYYDFILTDTNQLYGYNVGDAEPVKLVNFINSDLSTTYFSNLIILDKETLIGTYNDYSEDNYRTVVSSFKKIDPSEVPDKKILTLGCLWLDYDVRTQVVKYNKSNDNYRIVITDYSQFNTEEDWSAGQKRLNSDIASGSGPDIIVASDMGSMRGYASKGLFADLNKFLDKDEDVDKEDLFPNVLEACTYNNKLFAIAPQFTISTLIGKTSKLNGKTSWTMEEFLNFKNSLPEGTRLFDRMSREELMNHMLTTCVTDYMDNTKAKCYFDSPEFISLLNLLKEYPTTEELYSSDDLIMYKDVMIEDSMEEDEAPYRNDKVALMTYTFWDISDAKYLMHIHFGEDVTFVGYPTKEGNGSALSTDVLYAISSKSKNQEAAWDFISYFVSPEYQDTIGWGFPLSMKQFDVLAKKAQERPYYMDGDQKIEYDDTYYMNGQEIVVEPLSDAEVKKIKDFVLSVNRLESYDEEIIAIIEEDVAPFFEGQKSAEEVVKIIQSRVGIFLNERQ